MAPPLRRQMEKMKRYPSGLHHHCDEDDDEDDDFRPERLGGRRMRKRRRKRRSLEATGRLKIPAGWTAEPGHVTRILLTSDPDVKTHSKAPP